MKISVAMPPGPHSLEYARVAEDHGYERVWLYDSPALYEDVWIRLAEIAAGTESIGVGAGVLVAHLRHPMVTAAAVATIEQMTPGRAAYAFGTGATARWTLNLKALAWSKVADYVRTVRGLLAGESVGIDGEICQMIHHPAWAAERQIDVPILLSAFGPKGQEIAVELADGVITMAPILAHEGKQWDWWAQMVTGTVLAEGEAGDSERVREAAGPWAVVVYHGTWQANPEAVDHLPGGREWRGEIERLRPEGERHLVAHAGHVTDLTDRDRAVLDAAGVDGPLSWIGTREEIRRLAEASGAAGVTELIFSPAGPDSAREIGRFAEAVPH